MTEEDMLMCLIFFIVGYLVARIMRGNGFSVGGSTSTQNCSSLKTAKECINNENCVLLSNNLYGCKDNDKQCIKSDTVIQLNDNLTCNEKFSGNWDKKCSFDNLNNDVAYVPEFINLEGNKKNQPDNIMNYNRFFTIDNNKVKENNITTFMVDTINNILDKCLN